MRARMCVYGVWLAGRGPQSQLLQLLAMKSSAVIARRGLPRWPNTKDTHAQCDGSSQEVAALSEHVRVSKEMRACMY